MCNIKIHASGDNLVPHLVEFHTLYLLGMSSDSDPLIIISKLQWPCEKAI